MKIRIIKSILLFIGVFILAAACSLFWIEDVVYKTNAENELVLLNEIEQLTTDAENHNPAKEQFAMLQEHLRSHTAPKQAERTRQTAVFYLCLSILCLFAVFGYVYFRILRPFSKLEEYAEQIAKGNLDMPLQYERTNFFGAFTWAFDHMRKEILTARKNEAQAVSENKTIIAALSHDIKMPLASIRAYAEGLEANLEADYESRQRYLTVIMKKCDEVSRLVNDLTLHSLSELERLEINEQMVSMPDLLAEVICDLQDSRLALKEPVPEAMLLADRKRMAQVLLNVLENAKKYAPGSKADIWAVKGQERYEIHIRDYGTGICPEDMPFAAQKFYRGKNAGEQPGSGLGLYIVDYIMKRMQGGMLLENHADGLEVVLWLPFRETDA